MTHEASGCDQFVGQYVRSLALVCVVIECDQWVVDLKIKYPIALASFLLGSILPTFCSVFVIGLLFLLL